MSEIEISGWILFVVMSDGAVSSAHFPTKELCEDAASVVQTGMTIAENEKYYAYLRAKRKEKREDAFTKCTPRPPKDEREREAAKKAVLRDEEQSLSWGGGTGGTYEVIASPDGLIRELSYSVGDEFVMGHGG